MMRPCKHRVPNAALAWLSPRVVKIKNLTGTSVIIISREEQDLRRNQASASVGASATSGNVGAPGQQQYSEERVFNSSYTTINDGHKTQIAIPSPATTVMITCATREANGWRVLFGNQAAVSGSRFIIRSHDDVALGESMTFHELLQL